MTTRVRVGAVVALLALVGVLLSVLSVASGPAAAAAGPASASATAHDPSGGPRARPSGPGVDFPGLPDRCYNDRTGTVGYHPCRLTSFRGRPTVLMWGDSHAWMYVGVVRDLARERRVNLVVMFAGACPASLPYPESSSVPHHTFCDRHNAQSMDYVQHMVRSGRPVRLLVSGFWGGYNQVFRAMQQARRDGTESGYTEFQEHSSLLAHQRTPVLFRRLADLGVRVDVVAQSGVAQGGAADEERPPCEAGEDPYRCDLPRSFVLDHESANSRWLAAAMRPLRGRLIDPSGVYCDAEVCHARVGSHATWYDNLHLGKGLTGTMRAWFTGTVPR